MIREKQREREGPVRINVDEKRYRTLGIIIKLFHLVNLKLTKCRIYRQINRFNIKLNHDITISKVKS